MRHSHSPIRTAGFYGRTPALLLAAALLLGSPATAAFAACNSAAECNDGNGCTQDSCDPVVGCKHLEDCQSPNQCLRSRCNTATNQCETPQDVCQVGECSVLCGPDEYCPLDCTNGDRCVDPYCDRFTGCALTPRNCDDGNACTVDSCDSAIGCVNSPVDCYDFDPCTTDSCNESSGCQFTAAPAAVCANDAPGVSQLLIQSKDKASKNKLQFKWSKGAFAASELGDPTGATSYSLCVYDASGIVARATAEPGTAMCGKKPCWSLVGDPLTGVKYADPTKPAISQGVSAVLAKSSTEGKGSLQVKAGGSTLPALVIDPAGLSFPVTAQIRTSNAGCWESSFSADDAKKNDGAVFKASHKAP